jgi:iron complex transport system permease protein
MTASSGGATLLTQPMLVVGAAFCTSLAASLVILLLARRAAPRRRCWCSGRGLGRLFTAGTMFLAVHGRRHPMAAMVFWTFGDTARADWIRWASLRG